jgi:hypothetical protein
MTGGRRSAANATPRLIVVKRSRELNHAQSAKRSGGSWVGRDWDGGFSTGAGG